MIPRGIINNTVDWKEISRCRHVPNQIFTFLGVSNEDPFDETSADVPNAHSAIIAARDKSATARSQRADSMIVSFKVGTVIRVVINVVLMLDQNKLTNIIPSNLHLPGQLRPARRHKTCTLDLLSVGGSKPATNGPASP